MNSTDILKIYPSLRKTLLNSKFLDIFPGGFSIATDVSCVTIIHNPIAAEFLRIKPWGQISFSHLGSLVEICQNGKRLAAKDIPIHRAAWDGEEVAGCDLEFVWEDGISKIGRFSSIPLIDKTGKICGAITTMVDITDIIHKASELSKQKMHLQNW